MTGRPRDGGGGGGDAGVSVQQLCDRGCFTPDTGVIVLVIVLQVWLCAASSVAGLQCASELTASMQCFKFNETGAVFDYWVSSPPPRLLWSPVASPHEKCKRL